MLMAFKIFSNQEECQRLVDIFVILLVFFHLEYDSAALCIFGMFPFRLDVPLEDINGVDLLPLIIDLVSKYSKMLRNRLVAFFASKNKKVFERLNGGFNPDIGQVGNSVQCMHSVQSITVPRLFLFRFA